MWEIEWKNMQLKTLQFSKYYIAEIWKKKIKRLRYSFPK